MLMVVDNESMGSSVVLGRDFLKQCNAKIITLDDKNVDQNGYGNKSLSRNGKENLDEYKSEMEITERKNSKENGDLTVGKFQAKNYEDDKLFERQLLSIEYSVSNVDYEIGEDLSFDLQLKFAKLIQEEYIDAVRPYEPNVRCKMKLTIEDGKPFNYAPKRLSYTERQKVQEILDEYVENGIIRPSESEYASPIVLVGKKNGGMRMCVDFRRLNKMTAKYKYPMPLIDDLLDRLVNKCLFSKLDLKNGYYHVHMHEDSIKYTSFTTPLGQYEFLRMPFGLTNAPFIFQRFINKVFEDMIRQGKVIIYLDDIMIATTDVDEHMNILSEVFKRLVENKLDLRLDKCSFFQKEIRYLGYMISGKGIKANKDGLAAILNFPVPCRVQDVKSFLGMCSYFRRFIKDFSIIAKPLHDMTKKDRKFVFGDDELNSFNTLKRKMVDAPVLAIYDPKDETELHCDASSIGFGAILLQRKYDNKFHPIYYFSKRTTNTESRYHSFELETLAIVYALQRFRIYLQGIPFKIVTDCNSLTLTLNKKELNPRIARWALELQNYEFKLVHRSGTRMKHVDALSRCNTILMIEDNTFEDNLVICQSKDHKIKEIKDMLGRTEHPLYEMRNGVIYKKIRKELVFYVPEAMEEQVLFKYHNEMGHVGTEKVIDIIGRSYWFPNMRRKVKDHIGNCLKCIAFSSKSGRQEGFLHNIPKGNIPFQVVHIDHFGPINNADAARRHILVVVDACTKFIRLYPTKTTKSKEAIEALRDYFRAYSRPAYIVSDRGTCFTSEEFEEFLDENNIEHIKIATGSPQANGQVERVNRDIGPMIAKLVNIEKNRPWYKVLAQVEYAMNNTVHRSLGEHPSKMLFGIGQRGEMVDCLRENVIENENKYRERNFEEIRDKAEEVQRKVQSYNKSYVDAKRQSPRVYQEGDYVMIKNFDSRLGVSSKLKPKFRGPYMVTKILGNDRYYIKDIEGFQRTQRPYEGTWAAHNMKPCLNRNYGGSNYVRQGNEEEREISHTEDETTREKDETHRITRRKSDRIRGS